MFNRVCCGDKIGARIEIHLNSDTDSNTDSHSQSFAFSTTFIRIQSRRLCFHRAFEMKLPCLVHVVLCRQLPGLFKRLWLLVRKNARASEWNVTSTSARVTAFGLVILNLYFLVSFILLSKQILVQTKFKHPTHSSTVSPLVVHQICGVLLLISLVGIHSSWLDSHEGEILPVTFHLILTREIVLLAAVSLYFYAFARRNFCLIMPVSFSYVITNKSLRYKFYFFDLLMQIN